MTTVAVIQARMNSTRVPGKIMLPLAGFPIIFHIIERLRHVKAIDRISVSVPEGTGQEVLVDYIGGLEDVSISSGPEEDLLRRLTLAAEEAEADTVVRIYGDSPAIDPGPAAILIETYEKEKLQFASIPDQSGYPMGYELEVYDMGCMAAACDEVRDADARQFVYTIFAGHPNRFRQTQIGFEPNLSDLNLLVDTPSDYERMQRIFSTLYPENSLFGLSEVRRLAALQPELFKGEAPS